MGFSLISCPDCPELNVLIDLYFYSFLLLHTDCFPCGVSFCDRLSPQEFGEPIYNQGGILCTIPNLDLHRTRSTPLNFSTLSGDAGGKTVDSMFQALQSNGRIMLKNAAQETGDIICLNLFRNSFSPEVKMDSDSIFTSMPAMATHSKC